MRKLLSLALAALMIILSLSPALAFSDVSSGETGGAAEILNMMGVMQGYPDGTFRPGAPLTRAQFCKMAVSAMDAQDRAEQYRNYTIFYDVRASYWASGFINLAVREKKIITGMPDGSFRPENPVTVGQAVTILMRMLGYADSDAGFRWPDGYMSLAREKGLLDGIGAGSSDSVKREIGALLFKNLLLAPMKSESGTGSPFISSVAGTLKENVLILSADAETSDGQSGGIRTDESDTSVYKARSALPADFEGQKGALALDGKGLAWVFIPYGLSRRDLTVGKAAYTYIEDASGARIELDESVPVVYDGKKYKYGDIWTDFYPGAFVSVYYEKNGTVSHIVYGMPFSSGQAAVLSGTIAAGENPLSSLFPGGSGAVIYKNGLPASVSDLRQYDVAVYDAQKNTVNVTDFKITGICEDVWPNTSTPVRITVMGHEFEVLSRAVRELSAFRIGDRVTLLITPDGSVAGVQKPSCVSAKPVGIVTSVSDGYMEARLLNGIPVKGKLGGPAAYKGQLAFITNSKIGYIGISGLAGTERGASLNLSAMTAGKAEIAANAAIFEQVTGKGPAARISLSDIAVKSVSSDKVLYLGYDFAGRVDTLLLDDVTGDRYTYGLFDYEKDAFDNSSGNLSAYNSKLSIDNGDGEDAASVTCGDLPLTGGEPGGLAPNSEDRLGRYIKLEELAEVSRYDFSGDETVRANGVSVPVSDSVQVYLRDMKRFDTLSRARGFADKFTLYIDRPVVSGGKVRVVIAE